MKLYLAPYAPNPRRVSMFLAEKGLQGVAGMEIVQVDLPGGAHRTEEFRAKSPLAQVPTLELEDGRTLTESRAICTYLETLYPEPNLMGRDGFERAHIEMWDRRAEQMFAYPLMLWVRNASPILAAVERNQSPALAEVNEKTAMRMARFFDAQLGESEFIAGDRFSTADITVLCGMDFAKMMRWRPGDDLPNLKRWRAAMAERPAGKVGP